MILLIAILLLVGWSAVATLVELRRDGYRRVPTDWSRIAGRDVRDAAESATLYR